jgi:hypothetical protein
VLLALGPGLDAPPAAETPSGGADAHAPGDVPPSDPTERFFWVAAGGDEGA